MLSSPSAIRRVADREPDARPNAGIVESCFRQDSGQLAVCTERLVRIVRARRRHGGRGRYSLLRCGCRRLLCQSLFPLLGRRQLFPMEGFHGHGPGEGDTGILHGRCNRDRSGHRGWRGWRLPDGLLALDTIRNTRRYRPSSPRRRCTLRVAGPRQKEPRPRQGHPPAPRQRPDSSASRPQGS